ncbi:MAG: hypothetical protein ACHRXM_40505, partial [Isosphaerales bacterium]
SWLVYNDPLGRFHLRHPQELHPSPRMIDPDSLELVDRRLGEGQDVFILRLPPGADDLKRDRPFRDTDEFGRAIDAYWAKRKVDVLRGPAGWLPDAKWLPVRVYRKELAVRTNGTDEKGKSVERVYIDHYLVFPNPNKSAQVESWTKRDDHVAFRTQAELMIKSFQFGPAEGEEKAKPATPSSPASRPPPPPP